MLSHFLRPVAYGSSNKIDITYHTSVESSTGTSPLTFSAVNIGTADTNRRVFVAIASRGSTAAVDVTAVTIGGQTATKMLDSGTSTSANLTAEIWSAIVTTGSTGDIVITYTGTRNWIVLSSYSGNNISSTAFATATRTATGSNPSVTINVKNGGALIAVDSSGADQSLSTWTGIIKDFGSNFAGDGWTSASQDNLSAQTSRTITLTTSANNHAMAVVSLQST